MQVWNVLHAAYWKYRMQNIAKNSPSEHHRTTLSGSIFATKASIDNPEKNLLDINISSTCPHNMVYFGPLAAEIVSLVWGTPGNFNGFCVLAALLHGISVVGISQTLRRWTEGATYWDYCRLLGLLAGRPSRWALAHISSWEFVFGMDIKWNGVVRQKKYMDTFLHFLKKSSFIRKWCIQCIQFNVMLLAIARAYTRLC